MRFDPPLTEGTFLRRYKRFLVDVELEDGSRVVAHSTNTGSLDGCLVPGAKVRLARAKNPDRKLAWTWIMIQPRRAWVGVDTSLAVPLVEEAMDSGLLPELGGYERRVREVKYGRAMDAGNEAESRIDILLSRGGTPPATKKKTPRSLWNDDERVYVEVKNTTLVVEEEAARLAAFPDAVTERGLKHLFELAHVVKTGQRAAVVFCSQRDDVEAFVPADEYHPEYGAALRRVVKAGVEAYAISVKLTATKAAPARRLEIRL
jgi:sugar fermentation stimulation protein A